MEEILSNQQVEHGSSGGIFFTCKGKYTGDVCTGLGIPDSPG